MLKNPKYRPYLKRLVIVFLVCLGFAIIVAALFIMIILIELLWLGIIELFGRLFSRK